MFRNRQGTAEQYIKEGENATAWTRLSRYRLATDTIRLQLLAWA
jgi:hypothetical protein